MCDEYNSPAAVNMTNWSIVWEWMNVHTYSTNIYLSIWDLTNTSGH